jgi:hypothetical protein
LFLENRVMLFPGLARSENKVLAIDMSRATILSFLGEEKVGS